MVGEPDVIVVGAGIIGAAVGRQLARRGLKTIIVDARGIAAGATQASAGVLAPYIEAPDSGPLHQLTVRSLNLYDTFITDLIGETRHPVEYQRQGTLEVADGAGSVARLTAVKALATEEGFDAQWLAPRDAAEIQPGLLAHDGALLVPAHGYVAAQALAEALIDAASHHGATFVHESVSAIEARTDAVEVRTTERVLRAATVVIAAGSWSQALSADATPVKPIRGQLLRLGWTGAPLTHIVWGERCYMVPWLDGTVLVGATVEDVGFDERTTADGVRHLIEAATALLPATADASFLGARAGLRPGTPDGVPVIGRSPTHPNIVYATGHYRNGILLAPLTADLVNNVITGAGTDPALALTLPSRF